MAYINISEWSAEHVAEWLGGLDDAVLPYAHFFINNQIDGRHLLTLLPDDLSHLNIVKIGHQELILDGVDLLRLLHYTLTTETLQSLALRVGCKARSLYNDLKRNGPKGEPENGKQERVSVSTLSAVSDLLIAVKSFISWLDRYPFEGQDKYSPIRKTVLKLSIELASTSQRDQFAEKPHDIIKNSALNVAELCDSLIQDFNDSLIIQPASLDVVCVKRKQDEELGMHIHSSYSGVHIIGGIKFQGPAQRCGRVEIGDEIVQVNYQTVVGWQLKKLVYAMREHPTEVYLTLKKRPRHTNIHGQVFVLKPFRIPSKKTALPRLHKWSESNAAALQEVFNSNNNLPNNREETDDDDSAFLPDAPSQTVAIDKNAMSSHYQVFPAKTRATVQRRATVSGSSPTVTRPPVSIEELVIGVPNLRKEAISRSISHDPSKHSAVLSPAQTHVEMQDALNGGSSDSLEEKNNTTLVIPIRKEEYTLLEGKGRLLLDTKPLPDLVSSKQQTPHYYCLQSPKEIRKYLTPDFHLNRNVNSNKPTQTGTDVKSELTKSCQVNIVGSPAQKATDIVRKEKEVPPLPPQIRKGSHFLSRTASRRVSCKDLGAGDCQGWLYKRKDSKGLLSSSRWVKRWVILKNQYFYCYRSKEDARAECLAYLPGFTISPAAECKAKKYAFKIYHSGTSVYFASDSQTDVSKWMNKMGLAAISYASHAADVYFSETEDDSEDSSNSHSSSSPVTCADIAPSRDYYRQASSSRPSDGPTKKSPIPKETGTQSPKHSYNFFGMGKMTNPVVPERPPKTSFGTRSEPAKLHQQGTQKLDVEEGNRLSGGSWSRDQDNGTNSLNRLRETSADNRQEKQSPKREAKELPQKKTEHLLPNHQQPRRQSQASVLSDQSVKHSVPPVGGNLTRCTSLQRLNSGNETWSDTLETMPRSNYSELSVLDREYRRLFGKKKSDAASPEGSDEASDQHSGWWNNSVPRSATSQQIHTLYTNKDSRKSPDARTPSTNSSTSTLVPVQEPNTITNVATAANQQQSSGNYPIYQNVPRPRVQDSGSETKFFVSGVNSINRSVFKKESKVPTPNEAKEGSPSSHSKISEVSSKLHKFSLSKQLSPSTSFKFFSSPKFVRKFVTSPKQERKQSSSSSSTSSVLQLKATKSDHSASNNKSPKAERTFLGSPKLARAIFGSPKQGRKGIKTATTAVQTDHTFDELIRLHQKSSPQGSSGSSSTTLKPSPSKESLDFSRSEEQNPINPINDGGLERVKSGSNSSLNSSASGSVVSSSGSAHFYVEARIRPQITISLPLVTEAACDDRSSSPETPRTPVKPTMGVSMLSKKRSPSSGSDRLPTSTDEDDPVGNRSEIVMLINNQSEDELVKMLEALRQAELTPDGVDLRERRRKTMLQPVEDLHTSQHLLEIRSLFRTLKDCEYEVSAIDELLREPVTSERLHDWLCRYPHLLPPEYC